MAIFTTPYDLAKPTVNGADDQDLWGSELNDNMDIINDGLVTANYSHVLAKTSLYPVTADDQNALVTGDVSGGGFSVTLPSAATVGDGWKVTVKKIDGSSNTLTVVGTIDGTADYLIVSQNSGATFCSNGTNWFVYSTIAGITGGAGTLAIAGGGTGATTAAGARSNLGLGTMATQDASAVAITGGTGVFSSLTASALTAPGIPTVTNSANGKIVIGAVTVQWGTVTVNTSPSSQAVTFATAFSGTPYYYGATGTTALSTTSGLITSASASGMTINYNGGGPSSAAIKYFVLGPT